MARNIKFSVLIPVYNVENFITQCVDTVLNQRYENFEVILINDGSTDSSGKICNDYAGKDKRIKVFHQKNQGLLIARRNAISKASGDFCLFLDSDDYWDYDLLETIYLIICEYDCDLVIFKYRKVSENGIYISEPPAVFTDKMIFEGKDKEKLFKKILNSSDLNNLVCKAVKRSIIDDDTDYFNYQKFNNAEDLLQTISLIYNAEKIVYIDKPMYNYRTASSSITQKFNVNCLRDITIARSSFLRYLKMLKLDSEDNLKLFYQFYFSSILSYIFDLINSNVVKSEKIEIFNEIKNLQLYIDSLNYIDTSKFLLRHKPIFYLFNKNHYQLLFVYVKTINFVRKSIKNLGA